MKKRLFIPAAIVALMGVAGYLGHAASAPADGLSDLTLANAEALADKEVDLGYDKNCLSNGSKFCAIGPHQYYWNSTPYPEDPEN